MATRKGSKSVQSLMTPTNLTYRGKVRPVSKAVAGLKVRRPRMAGTKLEPWNRYLERY